MAQDISNQHFAGRLRSGELLIGSLLSLNSPPIAEAMSTIGYDWLFIDAEHGAFLPQDVQAMLQAANPCPCVIRLPALEEIWIKKALDIGAAGVIMPQVNTQEDAKNIVQWAKYSPMGSRGVGIGRAHQYGLGFEQTIQNANSETAVILQAESKQAVENIDDILSVEGIDAILIGPYDLSASLGVIGEVDNPIVVAAIDTIHTACRKANVQTGIFGVHTNSVKPYMEKGFRLILVGVDTVFLTQSASNTLKELRG